MLDRFKGQLLKNGAVSCTTQEKGAWPAVPPVSEVSLFLRSSEYWLLSRQQFASHHVLESVFIYVIEVSAILQKGRFLPG
jgi:hypothetical protein